MSWKKTKGKLFSSDLYTHTKVYLNCEISTNDNSTQKARAETAGGKTAGSASTHTHTHTHTHTLAPPHFDAWRSLFNLFLKIF